MAKKNFFRQVAEAVWPQSRAVENPIIGIDSTDIKLTDNEEDVLKKARLLLDEARPFVEAKKKEWQTSWRYLLEDIWEGELLEKNEYQSDIHLNRFFPNIRNMVGYLSDSRPRPDIIPPPYIPEPSSVEGENEALAAAIDERQRKRKHQASLYNAACDNHWDRLKMQDKITKALWRIFPECDVDFQLFWNKIENDFDIEMRRGGEVLWDPTILESGNFDQARYVIVEVVKNRQWVRENYPDLEDEVEFSVAADNKSERGGYVGAQQFNRLRDTIVVRQIFFRGLGFIKNDKGENISDPGVMAVVLGDGDKMKVAEKSPSPFWPKKTIFEQFKDWLKSRESADERARFAGIDEEQFEQMAAADELPPSFNPVVPYFKRPPLPIVRLQGFNTGHLYSISLMAQLFTIQRAIDRRKKQIDDIASLMGNPQWVYDSNIMTKDEAAFLTNQPGLTIGVNDPARIRRESGQEVPATLITDLRDSQFMFDQIFGQHDISRGSTERVRSATEAEILRESDRTSVRLLGRQIGRFTLSCYEWFIHLMKMFYDEKHFVEIISPEGAPQAIAYDRTDFVDGISVRIVEGSELPKDKAALRRDGIQLAQGNMMDPMTLFEIYDVPNPRLAANRLLNWKYGIISDNPPPTPEEQAAKERDAARVSDANARASELAARNEQILLNLRGAGNLPQGV